MKKSTKFLSVVLAVLMVFSSMTAAICAGAADYTKVKDFKLNADQSATLLLDYVDNMLAENAAKDKNGGKFSFSIPLLVDISIDYSSIDKALSTVYSTLNKYKSVLKSFGDVKNLKFDMLKGVQRKGGDLKVVYALLDFLNQNSDLFVKVINGNLSLGAANSFFNVNDEIKNMIKKETNNQASDIPGFVRYFLYSATLSNKLGFPETMSEAGIKTADEILNKFLNAYLTTDATKDFGGKALLPSLNGKIDINSGSVYSFLETAVNAAYKDLAVTPLNNDVKAIIAQYVCGGVKTDITESVTDAQKALVASSAENPATALTDSGIAAVENGFLFRSGNSYYTIDTTNANELIKIFDFNYKMPAEMKFTAGDGTITSNVNNIFGLIVKSVLNDEFEAKVNWKDGGNELLTENIANTAKVVLPLCPDSFFKGLDSATVAQIKNPNSAMQPKELVNYFVNILIKVLVPEISESLADADTFIEVGAVLANYFGNRVSSTIDYSDKIYKDGKIAEKTDAEWIDMLLDLGMEIAMYYVDLNTNIDVDKAKMAEYKTLAAKANVSLADFILDDLVDWALIDYADGVFVAGDNIAGKRGVYDGNGGWYKFNKIINSIFPMEFLNDASGNSEFAMDVEYVLKDKILKNLLNLDVADAINVFAKNSNKGNILNETPVTAILKVVQKLINSIFPNTVADKYLKNIETLIGAESLGALIKNLLSAINTRKDKLIPALLPIVLSFMDDFVSETSLVLKSAFDKELGEVTLKTVLSQKYAKTFGVGDGIANGTSSKVTIVRAGTLIAGDSYMKSKGLNTLALNNVDDKNVVNIKSYHFNNDNATEDNKGYYTFEAKITGINNLTTDKEVYAVSYVTYKVGRTEKTVYAANGYSIHLDVADR